MSHTTFYKDPSGNDIGFIHNGDFSGDIELTVLPEAVITTDMKIIVTIPFEALKFIVAQYVSNRMVERFEMAGPDEVLFSGKH